MPAALDGSPGFASLQDINDDPRNSIEVLGRPTQLGLRGAINPSPLSVVPDRQLLEASTAQKRTRPDDGERAQRKRTRRSERTGSIVQQESLEEPWSIFRSRSERSPGTSATHKPLAIPLTRRRSRLSQTSGSEQQETLLSTTKAEDISKALCSEARSCRSWEGIQRTIKLGLLKLVKPDTLKASETPSADSSPPSQGNKARTKTSCDVCGKTMKRPCELKSVSPFIACFLLPLARDVATTLSFRL